MSKKIAKKVKKLTEKQLEVLHLLYRFRFGTAELLADAQETGKQAAYIRLQALTKMSYLKRKQSGQDKLQGKPAVYSLAKKGRDELAKDKKYAPKILNAIRKNTEPSETFVQHNLELFHLFNALKRKTTSDISFLTKSNFASDKYSFMLKALPDALVHLPSEGLQFFVYLLRDDVPDFGHMRRLAQFFSYEDSGKWETATGSDFPKIIAICKSKRLQTTMHKRLRYFLTKFESETSYATSLLEQIVDSPDTNIWKTADGELKPLNEV